MWRVRRYQQQWIHHRMGNHQSQRHQKLLRLILPGVMMTLHRTLPSLRLLVNRRSPQHKYLAKKRPPLQAKSPNHESLARPKPLDLYLLAKLKRQLSLKMLSSPKRRTASGKQPNLIVLQDRQSLQHPRELRERESNAQHPFNRIQQLPNSLEWSELAQQKAPQPKAWRERDFVDVSGRTRSLCPVFLP